MLIKGMQAKHITIGAPKAINRADCLADIDMGNGCTAIAGILEVELAPKSKPKPSAPKHFHGGFPAAAEVHAHMYVYACMQQIF